MPPQPRGNQNHWATELKSDRRRASWMMYWLIFASCTECFIFLFYNSIHHTSKPVYNNNQKSQMPPHTRFADIVYLTDCCNMSQVFHCHYPTETCRNKKSFCNKVFLPAHHWKDNKIYIYYYFISFSVTQKISSLPWWLILKNIIKILPSVFPLPCWLYTYLKWFLAAS